MKFVDSFVYEFSLFSASHFLGSILVGFSLVDLTTNAVVLNVRDLG